MNVTAIIAEYNPFHNGHLYQIETIRKKHNADYIIVVMSGDFMQRGIPAVVNKYERCRMALLNGADMVFELPVYSALGSAEYFAKGAVSLLDKLGVVNYLHFGSESGDISILRECAKSITQETDAYKKALNVYLKQGLSFPAARSRALSDIHPGIDVQKVSRTPNNILGIEYIKALMQRSSAIKPVTLARKGAGYSSACLTSDSFVSANAIRNALFSKSCNAVKKHVPKSVYSLLAQEHLSTNDFSGILLYKMLSLSGKKDAFAEYYDVGRQISHTLHNNLSKFTSFNNFILLCKSKNLTYARICRGLMHILLDMTQENADSLKYNDYTQYARLLGFTSHGQDLLKSIKANTSIPLLTKPASALRQLTDTARMSFQSDIYAASVYESVRQQKRYRLSNNTVNTSFQNELTCELIKLP